IVVFILILGILIFAHEFGHFICAKRAGVKIIEFGFGFPPRIYGRKYKGTIYSINAIPLGGFVRIYGEEGKRVGKRDSFASRSIWERFKILAAGVFFNILLAILILSIYFWMGGPTIASDPTSYTSPSKVTFETMVWQAEKGSPAESAGLERGDVLLAINGQKVTDFSVVSDIVKKNPNQTVNIEILRQKEDKNIAALLADKNGQGFLGVQAIENYLSAHYPWWKVPYIAVVETARIIWVILSFLFMYLKDLIFKSQVPKDLAGPVGIFVLTREAVKLGAAEVMRFIALLSINLAIINILPLPALDGGRILFIFIEKIRGKKVTPKTENMVHTIGFAALLVLILLITYQDVIKFVLKK
ncbi:MAG: RIP metalloprotease RseP, partial [Candidatus Berkelbacteria bacterium]|nr:RIP metalloprotease RseP [Candidatus Berkelbacteria bacterium]